MQSEGNIFGICCSIGALLLDLLKGITAVSLPVAPFTDITSPNTRHTMRNTGAASSPRFSVRQKIDHPVYSAIHVADDCNKRGTAPFLFHNGADIKFKAAHGCMKLHQDS
jgi:hypothetical protein